jgi:hypothetical protein
MMEYWKIEETIFFSRYSMVPFFFTLCVLCDLCGEEIKKDRESR